MHIANAIRFIQSSPDLLIRARFMALSEAAPAPETVINALAATQNADGGWPLEGIAGRPSTLHDTCRMLTNLIELDEVESAPAQRARAFLVGKQLPRGWWRESGQITQYNPPMWMDAEADAALPYTTALCAATLAATDAELLAVDQAVAWLQGQIAPTGLLPGFRIHATAWAIPAFTAISHRESRSVKRMVGGLGDLLSPEWDASSLGLVLTALSQAGFPRATKLVERGLKLLTPLQAPDGSWPDEDGQADANLTLQIIRAARRFGLR